ncbi:protein translocase subunit SecF [Candidatus Woesearchaeota archaeon]|nr:protein translocase subunit SecF [Candidatus Woesearchaeota archaeon]
MKLKDIYEQKYKVLLLIPFIILVLALLQIGIQTAVTGDFVNKGITLKGGSSITLDKTDMVNVEELGLFLQDKFPKADINVRTISSAGQVVSVAVDSDAQENSEINALTKAVTEKYNLGKGDYSIEVMGSALGNSFFKQTFMALIIAFLLMGIVVLIYFRTIIPSLAVILAALSDIIVTLSIFNLTGIKLSTAGIAAFLMLIGYSVDTDILLSTRLLKRKEGTVMDRVYGAMKTGLTMSTTTLVAIGVALIFVESEVVKQIMIILFIGLLVDLVMTWIQNVGILRMYIEKKRK